MTNEIQRNTQDLWKRDLAAALLMLKTEREALDLLSDILSDEELERVPRRWQVIKCLLGGTDFRSIRQITGASNYMISRANRAVVREGTGISKTIMERLSSLDSSKALG